MYPLVGEDPADWHTESLKRDVRKISPYLHSLLTLCTVRSQFKIIRLFGTRNRAAGLAYVWLQSVARIALPRADANRFFFH